mmetsp:Transcript_988/g.1407  ORF Transcript_988/g.1407 Transcript_988/m.1407 type:complete len:255 (+) Transcript_988:167-931(+)
METLQTMEREKKRSPLFLSCVVIGLLCLVFYGISTTKEEDSDDIAPAVEDQYVKKRNSNPNPIVWFSIRIGKTLLAERVVFELFVDVVPMTVENFRCLCVGHTRSSDGRRLSYKGSPFHKVLPGSFVKGGDIIYKNGTGGYSIYGSTFPNENFVLSHTRKYLLSMVNLSGPDTTSSQFLITTARAPYLDGRHVVIGKVIAGHDVVDAIEIEGMKKEKLALKVTIVDSGEITNEKEKRKHLEADQQSKKNGLRKY